MNGSDEGFHFARAGRAARVGRGQAQRHVSTSRHNFGRLGVQIEALLHVAEHHGHREFFQSRDAESEVRVPCKRAPRERDDRQVPDAFVRQSPVQKRRIVGGAARPAGLRKQKGAFVWIKAGGFGCFEQLTDRDDCRITGVVVDVTQTERDGVIRNARKKPHVVSERAQNVDQKRKVHGRHLRRAKRRFLSKFEVPPQTAAQSDTADAVPFIG